MNTILIAWIVSLMTTISPPGRDAQVQRLPGWAETEDERVQRYNEIAAALVDVVFDTEEEPLEGTTREQTARILLAIAWHESSFAKDVDIGPCYRGKGYEKRCDYGRSVCMMQLHAPGRTTIAGFTRSELVGDRRTCFRAGLRVAQQSFTTCRKPYTQLNLYATGYCDRGTSNTRMKLATARAFLPFTE